MSQTSLFLDMFACMTFVHLPIIKDKWDLFKKSMLSYHKNLYCELWTRAKHKSKMVLYFSMFYKKVMSLKQGL